MPLAHRRIDLTFQLGKGSFGQDGSDTVKLTGLRVSCNIDKVGGSAMSNLTLRAYGIPLSVMNKLTVIGQQVSQGDVRFNQITVAAGDDSGVAVAFNGVISQAWIDASSPPAVSFVVVANTGLLDKMRPVSPVSYKGTVDAATVIAGIAATMVPPRTLENNGVTGQLSNPYFVGTALEQLQSAARAINCYCVLDEDPGPIVAIWPAGSTRTGLIPVISADTGMVGYPVHTDSAIQVTTLYNPGLGFGKRCKVVSGLTPASGEWVIAHLSHDLESETPDGKWFTTAACSIIGAPTVELSQG